MSDILRWETRKTRKPHRCFGCDRVYPAGTEMVNAAYAESGEAYSLYWCETCTTVMHRYGEHGDEYGHGEVVDFDEWQSVHDEICAEQDRPQGWPEGGAG